MRRRRLFEIIRLMKPSTTPVHKQPYGIYHIQYTSMFDVDCL